MTDASPAGFGVVRTSWHKRDVRSVGVYNERLRFSLDYVQGKGARASALGLSDPLQDFDTVKPVGDPPSWQWKELLGEPPQGSITDHELTVFEAAEQSALAGPLMVPVDKRTHGS